MDAEFQQQKMGVSFFCLISTAFSCSSSSNAGGQGVSAEWSATLGGKRPEKAEIGVHLIKVIPIEHQVLRSAAHRWHVRFKVGLIFGVRARCIGWVGMQSAVVLVGKSCGGIVVLRF